MAKLENALDKAMSNTIDRFEREDRSLIPRVTEVDQLLVAFKSLIDAYLMRIQKPHMPLPQNNETFGTHG